MTNPQEKPRVPKQKTLPPSSNVRAVIMHRNAQSQGKRFVTECLLLTADPRNKLTLIDLFDYYSNWCNYLKVPIYFYTTRLLSTFLTESGILVQRGTCNKLWVYCIKMTAACPLETHKPFVYDHTY
jgi:hypothetical protein